MSFAADAIFKPCPGAEVTQVDDGVVVYVASTETVHHLNPSAALIYDLCREGRSLGEIATFLAQQFTLTETPAGPVEACIEQLTSSGLIEST